MKVRTRIILSDERYFESKEGDFSETELDEMKQFYQDNVGKFTYLSFESDDDVWYCFPGEALSDAIICMIVTEQ
jgi:hypothetical protein